MASALESSFLDALIGGALAAGYSVGVRLDGPYSVEDCSDRAAILSAVASFEASAASCCLVFRRSRRRLGFVRLAFGGPADGSGFVTVFPWMKSSSCFAEVEALIASALSASGLPCPVFQGFLDDTGGSPVVALVAPDLFGGLLRD